MTDDLRLSAQLREILGEEGFVFLCQELGGLRVYVPRKFSDENDIVQAVGRDLAEKLGGELAPATIRVPLARRERALYWRDKGLSNGRVARKIGLTESGVNKLFQREDSLPEKAGSGISTPQLSLF